MYYYYGIEIGLIIQKGWKIINRDKQICNVKECKK